MVKHSTQSPKISGTSEKSSLSSGKSKSSSRSRSRSPNILEDDKVNGNGDEGGETAAGRGRGRRSQHSRSPHHHRSSGTKYHYTVLSVSSIKHGVSDEIIKKAIDDSWRKFGYVSVKIIRQLDERVAFVYFPSYKKAREARHAKPRLTIGFQPVVIEAAVETSSYSRFAPTKYVSNVNRSVFVAPLGSAIVKNNTTNSNVGGGAVAEMNMTQK